MNIESPSWLVAAIILPIIATIVSLLLGSLVAREKISENLATKLRNFTSIIVAAITAILVIAIVNSWWHGNNSDNNALSQKYVLWQISTIDSQQGFDSSSDDSSRYFDVNSNIDKPSLNIIPDIDLEIAFHIEPLSAFFALLASILWFITNIYAIGYMSHNKEPRQFLFFGCFAAAIFCALGIAFSANLFTFFIFYEAMTLMTLPLVTHNRNKEAYGSGKTYLLILIGTSICFQLLAITGIYIYAGTIDFTEGGVLQEVSPALIAIFLALFCFGVGKAALMPFHKWLPAAMVAPTPVSALLHAVAVVKAGIFGIAKAVTYIFGIENLANITSIGENGSWIYGDWLAWAAMITIITASITALRQDNLKKRLAYSTISQLSYMVLAIAMFNPIAMTGAAFHMIAHGFGKISLFFAAGSIYSFSKKKYVSELNGIGYRLPFTMFAFTIGTLAMIALTPTFSAVSKHYIMDGAMSVNNGLAIATLWFSTVFNVLYLTPVIWRAFLCKPKNAGDNNKYRENNIFIIAPLTITSLSAIGLYFYYQPLIDIWSNLIYLT